VRPQFIFLMLLCFVLHLRGSQGVMAGSPSPRCSSARVSRLAPCRPQDTVQRLRREAGTQEPEPAGGPAPNHNDSPPQAPSQAGEQADRMLGVSQRRSLCRLPAV
jgi:hypothetical protein